MSITPTYPGVYVSELPSGNRTITGVATAITAFVGAADRGPVDEPVPIASLADFVRAFGPLSRDQGLGYAVRDFYLNGGGPALVVRVAHLPENAPPPDDPDDPPVVAPEDWAKAATLRAAGVTFEARGPGAWGNDLEIDVHHLLTKELAEDIAISQGLPKETFVFNLSVRLGKVGVAREREFYPNLTLVDGPRRVDRVVRSSRLVRVVGAPPWTPPARPADPADPADPPLAEEDLTISTTVESGTPGTDGLPPAYEDYFPGRDRGGVSALDAADLVNILVLPPASPSGSVPDTLWTPALKYAVDRRSFLIVDPPPDKPRDDVAEWPTSKAGLSSTTANHAALFYPRLVEADPLRGGATGDFAASGAMAGIFARTDARRGVWKAPAGLEAGVAGALGPSEVLTDAENGELNRRGVNVIRQFTGVGTVNWGARTLRGNDQLSDDYKYIPVRRLSLYIQESLYRGTQWVVFEPNDEPLWSQIRASVGSFMQDLFRKGAFQGASPKEAYFVKCSAETTTQYDIDRGIVNIQVGFAPLKPAEFVMITIQQISPAAGE